DSEVMKEILPLGYYYSYKDIDELRKIMKLTINEQAKIKIKELSYPNSNYSWEQMVSIVIGSIAEVL
ncbi:MAG: hypothetical protein RSF67_09670, partial [Clostridia bacterium]